MLMVLPGLMRLKMIGEAWGWERSEKLEVAV